MSTTTVKVLAMSSFKELVSTTKIAVRKARKTGNLYGVNDNEELVCYFAPDTKFNEPINVLQQRKVDEDGAVEEWYFAVNGSAPENVAVL